MKLNNKGLTLVELIISFAILSLLVFAMLQTVMSVRSNASEKLFEKDMEIYKNTLIKDIEDDLIHGQIKSSSCEGFSCIITFLDDSTKALSISKKEKTITYNGKIYEMPNKERIVFKGVGFRAIQISSASSLLKISVTYYEKSNKDNEQEILLTHVYDGTATQIYSGEKILTIDLDDGSIPATYNLDTGETFDLPSTTRTGYVFTGWNISEETTTISGSELTMGSSATTITAQWSARGYTVIYSCNGSSGSTASSTHTYGVDKSLTPNGCYYIDAADKKIYSFIGWALTPTGEAIYEDKEIVTNLTETATITLYAQWTNLFTYSNSSYTIINDTGGNWRVKFLASGTLTIHTPVKIDAFLVGGGGGGGNASTSCNNQVGNGGGGGGGGGGYAITGSASLEPQSYTITVGYGGSSGNNGGPTSAFGLPNATGGYGGGTGQGVAETAVSGGSGGNAGGCGGFYGCEGSGGSQATREFGVAGATPYAGGGGGGFRTYSIGGNIGNAGGIGGGGRGGASSGFSGGPGSSGANNYGGGGGGGSAACSSAGSAGGSGGTGIIIIRNQR